MLTDSIKRANWLDTLMNPAIRNALLGAGTGAAVTGLTSAAQKSPKSETSSERRRRILRNALAGGVFGGGAGYLLPKALDVMRNAAPPNTEAADTADEWGKAFAPDTAAGGMYGRMAGVGGAYGLSRGIAHGRETKFIKGQAGDFFNRLNKHFDELGAKATAEAKAWAASKAPDAVAYKAMAKTDPAAAQKMLEDKVNSLKSTNAASQSSQFTEELRRRWGKLKIDDLPLTDKTMTDKVLLDTLRGSRPGGGPTQFDAQTKLLKDMSGGYRLTGSGRLAGPWGRAFTDRSAPVTVDGRTTGGLPGAVGRHGWKGGLGMAAGAFLPEIGRGVPHIGAWLSDMFGAKSLSDPPNQ